MRETNRWRITKRRAIVLLLVAMSLAITTPSLHLPQSAKGLPANNRSIGLRADSSGWHDLSTSTNPTITIYDDSNVTVFLYSGDGANHRLLIFTPTLIQSPGFSGSTVVKFSFTLDTAGVYGYCDSYTGACGTLRVNVIGDVNGDFSVTTADRDIINSNFGKSLNTTWKSADKPYLDGRVDYTDLNIVSYFFSVPPPWPAPYNPDVNGDGKVDVLDLAAVSGAMGQTAPAPFNNPNQGPDLNYDNTVNIVDLSTWGSHNGCTILTCR